jgi:uncharacterized delta-60 repeat protein
MPDGSLDLSFRPGVDGAVLGLALQSDGYIWITGSFTNVNGRRRPGLARLDPEGRLDESVEPAFSINGQGLTLLPDGHLILDHAWGRLRLLNNMPAQRVFERQQGRLKLTTYGSCPAFNDVQFAWSSNRTDWIELGWADLSPEGWVWSGNVPSTNGWLRARGRVTCGRYNASYYWVDLLMGPPVLESPAQEVDVVVDEPAAWAVVAPPMADTRVQWWKDGSLVYERFESAASPVYEYRVEAASAAHEGTWTLVLSNAYGSATSAPVRVNLLDPLIRPPALLSQVVMLGSAFTITPEVHASQPARYQWFQDGMPLVNETNRTLAFDSVQLNDAGLYELAVYNARGAVTTAVIRLIPSTLRTDPASGQMFNTASWVDALAMQPDGRLLAAGTFLDTTPFGTIFTNSVLRWTDVVRDPGFRTGRAWPTLGDLVLGVDLDGTVWLAGGFTQLAGLQRPYLARLLGNGQVDTNFVPSLNGPALALAIQPDGKLLVAGAFTQLDGEEQRALARFHPDGTWDNTFRPSLAGVAYDVAVDSWGRILVGGTNLAVRSDEPTAIVRLDANGSPDASFEARVQGLVRMILPLPDGGVLIGGVLTQVEGQPCPHLVLLDERGRWNTNFVISPNGGVRRGCVQANGSVWILGDFNRIDDRFVDQLAHIRLDGSWDPAARLYTESVLRALALDSQGRLWIGGDSGGNLMGQPWLGLTRILTGQPAESRLSYDGRSLTWLRRGAAPQLSWVRFDASVDGVSWMLLGHGVWTGESWRLDGIRLPENTRVRARGAVVGGAWWVEERLEPAVPPLQLRASLRPHPAALVLRLMGASDTVYDIMTSTNLREWTLFQSITNTTLYTDFEVPLIGEPQRYFRAVRRAGP